jgi:hypothetical protein
MKLAGIDGVILDWYGTIDYQDHALIHRNGSAFAERAAKTGLEFAVCFEDRTIPKLVEGGRLAGGQRVQHARREIAWLRATWFDKAPYLKLEGKPVLLSFGRDRLTDIEWAQALGSRADAPVYLSEHERRGGVRWNRRTGSFVSTKATRAKFGTSSSVVLNVC